MPKDDTAVSISLHPLVFLTTLGLLLTHLQRRIGHSLLLKVLHMQVCVLVFFFNLVWLKGYSDVYSI